MGAHSPVDASIGNVSRKGGPAEGKEVSEGPAPLRSICLALLDVFGFDFYNKPGKSY